MDMHGQRVVVVGGTSGIGLAVARAALGRGADVVVASARQASVDAALSRLGALASRAPADNTWTSRAPVDARRASDAPADSTSADSTSADSTSADSTSADGARVTGSTIAVTDAAAVARFLDTVGGFDHLVYTAGEALSLMPLAEFDLDRAQEFFRTRYFGALTVAQVAAPRLRPGGSITLTSGSAADRPGAGWAVAAGVCGAMNAVTRALAVELGPIRVNAVAPGVVRSPLWSGMSEADREAMYEGAGRSLPVGRVGEVDDVAEAYLYCMAQPYGTGAVVHVDGGGLLV